MIHTSFTAPETLPLRHKIAMALLEPQPIIAKSPTRGGALHVIELGERRWLGQFETTVLSRAQADVWRAWLARRQFGRVTFLGFDPLLQAPGGPPQTGVSLSSLTVRLSSITQRLSAARHGFGADWQMSVTDRANRRVRVSGLPIGATLPEGTRISAAFGVGFWRLYTVLSATAADSLGQATLTLDALPPDRPDPVPAFLAPAYLEMALLADTVEWSRPAPFQERLKFSAVSVSY